MRTGACVAILTALSALTFGSVSRAQDGLREEMIVSLTFDGTFNVDNHAKGLITIQAAPYQRRLSLLRCQALSVKDTDQGGRWMSLTIASNLAGVGYRGRADVNNASRLTSPDLSATLQSGTQYEIRVDHENGNCAAAELVCRVIVE